MVMLYPILLNSSPVHDDPRLIAINLLKGVKQLKVMNF